MLMERFLSHKLVIGKEGRVLFPCVGLRLSCCNGRGSLTRGGRCACLELELGIGNWNYLIKIPYVRTLKSLQGQTVTLSVRS